MRILKEAFDAEDATGNKLQDYLLPFMSIFEKYKHMFIEQTPLLAQVIERYINSTSNSENSFRLLTPEEIEIALDINSTEDIPKNLILDWSLVLLSTKELMQLRRECNIADATVASISEVKHVNTNFRVYFLNYYQAVRPIVFSTGKRKLSLIRSLTSSKSQEAYIYKNIEIAKKTVEVAIDIFS